MIDALICEPLRTPVGRYGGILKDVTPVALAELVLREMVRRTGLRGEDIDDVIFAQCYPNGEAPAIGRVAALDAGLGVSVPGLQLDRRCGSGLQAVADAAMRVQTGVADLVIAGGAESMSQAEHYIVGARFGLKGDAPPMWDRIARGRITAGGRFHPVPGGMLETAENLRRDYSVSREEQDAFALRSHQNAVAAQREGRFADEIVPVPIKGRRGPELVSTDEHPRADVSLEGLAALKAVRLGADPQATVTAGNASGQNDGASACIVASPKKAAELGLRPIARLVSWAVAGVEPERMGIGPVPASERALSRAGLALKDMDLIELNEAFAAQALAVTRTCGLDPSKINPLGGAIALGHPLGATGAIRTATIVHGLRRRKQKYGMVTMCIGTGMGAAGIFEAL